MQNLTILNSREIKDILGVIEKQWGADLKKRLSGYVVLQSGKGKIYLLSRDFALVDDKKLRIDSAGMYFGELLENSSLRLSIEGSQLVGLSAKKNVVELDEEGARSWMSGRDIEGDFDAEGFVILKNRNKETGKYDFLGCGKYKKDEMKKDMKILNYVPKTRRVTS